VGKSCFLFLNFCIVTCFAPIRAQEIGFYNEFFGFADNREYKSVHTEDKTIFGVIYSPGLQVSVDDQHHVYVGAYYRKDVGARANHFNSTLYYNFRDENFDFALGLMPRHERLRDVPRMVLADTFLYDRPNIEGMHLAFRKNGIWQSLYIDWLSKQDIEDRERFVVGLSGKFCFGSFYLAEDALLYHNALTSSGNPDEHVQDNGVVLLRIGWDGRKSGLDSLTADAGYAMGFDRLRTVYAMRRSLGFVANLYGEHKRFFLANTLYLGQAQQLPMGDPFYRRGTYNRLDIGWFPFRKTFERKKSKKPTIEGKLTFSIHFAADQTSNQQAFLLRIRM